MKIKKLVIFCIVVCLAVVLAELYKGSEIKQPKLNNTKEMNLISNAEEQNIEALPILELKYNRSINAKRNKCLDNANIFELYKCEVNAAYEWDREINKNLRYLKGTLEPQSYDYIANNQKLWEKYEEDSEKLVYRHIILKDGYINEKIGHGYLSKIKEQRNEQLNDMYVAYNTGMLRKSQLKDINNFEENEKIEKQVNALRARTTKEEFSQIMRNQKYWEEFVQSGFDFMAENEIKKLYTYRVIFLRNLYNQYCKTKLLNKE